MNDYEESSEEEDSTPESGVSESETGKRRNDRYTSLTNLFR